VTPAISLYESCLEHTPDSSSYALNLMHLHELHLDPMAAIKVLTAHCEANPTATVGTTSLAELVALLPAPETLAGLVWTPPTDEQVAATAKNYAAMLPELSESAGAESLAPERCKPAGTYSEAELDVLALMYTGVKILYVAGALQLLPPLIKLIEPLREVKDLHLTRVRNENAYYCCTAQLMTTMPLPRPACPPLYLAGDSHSLSPAWRTVTFRKQEHVLVPRLVTGCKIWHLREASDFFTKANFEAAMATIPDGSPVVFMFGEIDCREGLLVAVERMRYASLEEGIAYTVKIYISVLKELAKSRKFKVLVHPVPPVLNETRHIVKPFNAQLVAAVKKEPSLHMLDFFSSLLTPDGTSLADGLKLDGTHMHPDYTKLMQPELDKVE